MIKTELAVERIFTTFIPGALFLIGTWYLHRPFLLKYFPNLAGDPSQTTGLSTEFKLMVFLVLSFCIGLTFNQLSDLGVALLFKDDATSEKSLRRTRRLFRSVWRLVAITLNLDPRTRAVTRYLNSPRRLPFLRMMEEWTGTNEELLQQRDEQIIAHQHVVLHLRALSDDSRRLLQDAQLHVVFSSSMLMAFLFLLPLAVFSIFTSDIVDEKVRVHFYRTLTFCIGLIYLGVVATSYSLKRQFKQFCNYVLTLALHFHQLSSQSLKTKSEMNSPSRES